MKFPSRPSPIKNGEPWYNRGYLPHYDDLVKPQALTFRLHDAMPREVVHKWKHELGITESIDSADPRCATLRRSIAKYEDAGYGQCWLRQSPIAEIVEDALMHFHGTRYTLIAWCIMPNHVHVLIARIGDEPIKTILHSWKSFTAKEINKTLSRSGAVWDTESHDRFIRDERHFQNAKAYIENNPVEAGLANAPFMWRYSSAWHTRNQKLQE